MQISNYILVILVRIHSKYSISFLFLREKCKTFNFERENMKQYTYSLKKKATKTCQISNNFK